MFPVHHHYLIMFLLLSLLPLLTTSFPCYLVLALKTPYLCKAKTPDEDFQVSIKDILILAVLTYNLYSLQMMESTILVPETVRTVDKLSNIQMVHKKTLRFMNNHAEAAMRGLG